MGCCSLCQVIPAAGFSESEVLQVAAALKSGSEQPIGAAIVQAAQDLDWSRAIEVQAYPGQGIAGSWRRRSVFVGTTSFMNQAIADLPIELVPLADSLEQGGKTVVWVLNR